MFKNAQVVLLTTEPIKQEEITRNGHYHEGLVLYRDKLFLEGYYANIYIISDDIIKENDWCLDIETNKIFQYKYNARSLSTTKKIIATTDSNLSVQLYNSQNGEQSYISNLPQPSNSFIKKYEEEDNKGNIITDIMVEYEDKGEEGWEGDDYTGEPIWRERLVLKVNSKDNTITIKKVKDSWNKDEVYELLKSFSSYKTNSFTSEDIEWIKRRLI